MKEARRWRDRMLQKSEKDANFSPEKVKIMLRKATKDDNRLLFEWRNNAETRQWSLNTATISWAEHERWLEKSLTNPDRTIFIFEENGTPAGTCRTDLETENGREVFELSWTIAPEQRGKGLGKKMLGELLALEFLRGKLVKAIVKSENLASVKMVEKLCFRFGRSERDADIWLLEN